MNTLQVVFTTVLNMSITASFVAIGVIIARLVLKKMPRIFSYALWSAVLIRLVFPVSFTSTFSFLTLIKPETQQTTGALAYVPYNLGLMQTPGIDVGVDGINKVVNSSLPQLTRVINLGSGGGNGAMPNENDTYEVKITVDGTTEEFELKAR